MASDLVFVDRGLGSESGMWDGDGAGDELTAIGVGDGVQDVDGNWDWGS